MCQKSITNLYQYPVINLIPEVTLYQQIPIGTSPIYVVGHICTFPVYIAACICTQPVYIVACVPVYTFRKIGISPFLKLRHFSTSVTSTCNLSLCPISSFPLCIHHCTYPLTKYIYISLFMYHTCVYNHDHV
jgi:hypothetical protein